jgi:FkbM family methyltransferase
MKQVLAAVRRGVGAVRHRLRARRFRPYLMRKSLAGEEFSILIGDLEASYLYDRVHAWPELAFVAEALIEPGDLVADCGANHGLTGLLFARKVGSSGKVIAFEPNPRNAEIARINARVNAIDNLEIREHALGSARGTVFFRPEMNGSVTHAGDAGAIRVECVTLDEAFAERAPDLLKIDVEGYELEVLAGARRVLSARPKFDVEIHVDTFRDPRASLRELFDLLDVPAYQTYVQRSIDGPITEVALDASALSELAVLRNVHLFGRPR